MALSMAHLLVHSEDIPAPARRELRRAIRTKRKDDMDSAARMLWLKTDLHCAEIKDLLV